MNDLLRMSIIFGGLVWFLIIAEPLPHWSWFFIILIAGNIIPALLFPTKRNRKKRAAKQNGGKVDQTKFKSSRRSDKEIVTANLNELDGYEFERLIALYFKDRGYKSEVVGGAGDHEVDVILTDPRDNSRIAIQCKHWKKNNVGNDTILRLSAGKAIHKCKTAWCITTSNYTKSAKEAAEGLDIRLFNGEQVEDFISKWQNQIRKENNRSLKQEKQYFDLMQFFEGYVRKYRRMNLSYQYNQSM